LPRVGHTHPRRLTDVGIRLWLYSVVSTDGDDKVVGVVTDRDIAIAAHTPGKPVFAIRMTRAMSYKVITCHANDG